MTIAAIRSPRAARSRPSRRRRVATRSHARRAHGSARCRSIDGGAIVGIISERDLVCCSARHGAEVLDWPVDAGMSSPAITVDTRDSGARRALALMTQRRIRHLPVVESGEIRGIVSIGDLVKHRIERIEAEAEAMRTYIQSA